VSEGAAPPIPHHADSAPAGHGGQWRWSTRARARLLRPSLLSAELSRIRSRRRHDGHRWPGLASLDPPPAPKDLGTYHNGAAEQQHEMLRSRWPDLTHLRRITSLPGLNRSRLTGTSSLDGSIH